MAKTVIWSADMTVVDYETGAIGAASADLFANVESGDGLAARELWYFTPARKLRLKFDESLDDVTGLTLEVGGLSLALAEESGGSPSFTWEDVDVEWSDGDTVAVRLTRTSEAEEPSAGVVLAFRMTLDAQQSAAVSVRYATADGTAMAGADYVAASGAVRFEAGETAQTVRVAVLDDGHDDPSETLALRLSAPFGARLADGEATGTIGNSDPLPRAWLARFGRTVAGHVTDAIAGRFEAAGAESQVVLGGQPLSPASDAAPAPGRDGAAAWDGVAAWDGWPGADGVRTVTARELLLGSSLLLAGASDAQVASDAAGGGASGRTAWAAWGRAAASQFDGAAEGVALDGDVMTFMLGADVAWSRWLAGAALAHSIGEGGYGEQGATAGEAGSGGGTLAVTLTSIHPYVRVQASERISLWAVLGYGAGELTLTPGTAGGTESAKAGTQMGMAAAGARGELLVAADTVTQEVAPDQRLPQRRKQRRQALQAVGDGALRQLQAMRAQVFQQPIGRSVMAILVEQHYCVARPDRQDRGGGQGSADQGDRLLGPPRLATPRPGTGRPPRRQAQLARGAAPCRCAPGSPPAATTRTPTRGSACPAASGGARRRARGPARSARADPRRAHGPTRPGARHPEVRRPSACHHHGHRTRARLRAHRP